MVILYSDKHTHIYIYIYRHTYKPKYTHKLTHTSIQRYIHIHTNTQTDTYHWNVYNCVDFHLCESEHGPALYEGEGGGV